MTTARRGIAGFAAAALTATGLAVLGAATAPSAHAASVSVDDAVLRWGINVEAGSAAFAPNTWNLMSAGKVGNPGKSQTLKSADEGATWADNTSAGWTNAEGNVTIEDLQAGGSYAPTTFLGTRQNAAGTTGTVANGVNGENQLVFRNGTGEVDVAANTASIQWDGDATILYYSGMTFFYLSDPELSVAADGTGEVTATVDGYAADMLDPTKWNDLAEQEVTLATLSGVDVAALGFTSTPAYSEVEYTAPASSTAQVRAGGSWGSFPQDFVDFQQLTGGGPYWYSTGGAADARKPTLPLEVSFDATPAPSVEVSDVELLPSGAHEVTVTGTGFEPALATGTRPPLAGKPGGAYVVFGKFPATWRPSAGVTSAMRKPGSQKWAVLAADMGSIGGADAGAVELAPDGSFTATVTVDKAAADSAAAAVDSAVNYGIYTYPGSGAVQASYETYTPITFAPSVSSAGLRITKVPTPAAAGSARLTIDPVEDGAVATGEVQFQLRSSAGAVLSTTSAALDATGVASVVLPKRVPGRYSLVATYAGTTDVAGLTRAAAVKITKVASRLSGAWAPRKPSGARAGGIRITAKAAGIKATGVVRIAVKNARGRTVRTAGARLTAAGRVTFALPRLAKGRYVLTASYRGNGSVDAGRYTLRFTTAKR